MTIVMRPWERDVPMERRVRVCVADLSWVGRARGRGRGRGDMFIEIGVEASWRRISILISCNICDIAVSDDEHGRCRAESLHASGSLEEADASRREWQMMSG